MILQNSGGGEQIYIHGNQQLYLQDEAGGGGGGGSQVFINQGDTGPQAGQVYVDETGAQVYYDPNQQEQQVVTQSFYWPDRGYVVLANQIKGFNVWFAKLRTLVCYYYCQQEQ